MGYLSILAAWSFNEEKYIKKAGNYGTWGKNFWEIGFTMVIGIRELFVLIDNKNDEA